MQKKFNWNERLNRELVDFIEEMKKQGNDVRYACSMFSCSHPGLQAERCRVHYYQLIDSSKNNSMGRSWSENETKIIIEEINNRGGKSKIDVARKLSNSFGRSSVNF